MKHIRPYLFVSLIIVLMIGVAAHYKIVEEKHKTKTSVKQDPMDSTLAILILSTVGILAGVIFNPELSKIKTKIDNYQNENRQQHIELGKDIRRIQTKFELETSLREIVDGILEITSDELSDFINKEGTIFIEFTKEIVNGAFTEACLPAIKTKLNRIKDDSNIESMGLGDDFYVAHLASQKACVDKLYAGIEETVMDDVFNSKHKRFRMLCEQFLHTHLTDSVRNYMKIKNRV